MGVVFALACSIMICVSTLIIKKARGKMDSVSVLFSTLSGSMLALLLWAIIGKVDLMPQSKDSWPYLFGLGIIVQGIGYFAINYTL